MSARRLAIAIETSTRRPSIAACTSATADDVVHRDLEGERAHASDLLPALAALLDAIGADRRELRRVVVGLGPGSLTGMRVGVATALGLVRGSGAELVGVASFEALAAAELAPGAIGLVVSDARGARFNVGAYHRDERDVRELAPLASLDEDGARSFLGEERFAHAAVFADDASAARFDLAARAPRPLRPRAEHVLRLGLAREPARSSGDVQPLYLRPFEGRTKRR